MLAGVLALLFGVILIYLIYPGKYTKDQKAMLSGRNYAHRGLHSKDKTIPENSMAAFKLSIKKGYGIELDVRLSKDREVMVFHDDTLKRICGIEGYFEDYTLKQLKNMKLGGTNEKIPTLKEVLNVVNGKVPIIIEIKSGKRNKELCEKLFKIVRDYKGAFCVQSFNPFIIFWFRKNAVEIMRGQLTMNRKEYKNIPTWMGVVMGNSLANAISRPHFIAYGTTSKSMLLKFAEKLGALKVVWTINDKMNYEKYQSINDAVIFEFYEPEPRYNQ